MTPEKEGREENLNYAAEEKVWKTFRRKNDGIMRIAAWMKK